MNPIGENELQGKLLGGAANIGAPGLSPQDQLKLQQEILAGAEAAIGTGLSRQERVGHYKSALKTRFAHCTDGTDVLTVESPTVDSATQDRIRGYRTRPYNPNQPVVVIPYETPDLPRNPHLTTQAIKNFFFGQNVQSVRTFFDHNSFYQYGLREGAISNWVRLPKSIAEYNTTAPENDWTRDAGPLREACELATNVDWAALDADGDGRINPEDAVLALVGAWGFAAGSARKQGDVEFRSQGRTFRLVDPFVVRVDCTKPTDSERGDAVMDFSRAGSNLSTTCHEFGHALFDLPDRYPAPDRVAHFDLMSDSNDLKFLNPLDRMRIGWLQPGLLHVGQVPPACHAFKANEVIESALIVYSSFAPDEFWLIENRHRGSAPAPGFDSGFPEDGLAIWWVDMATNAVALIRRSAPGMRPLDQPVYPMQGELFTATDVFTQTDAVLVPQYGKGTLIVRRISPDGPTMYAEV
jgi:M6 family metalloprotease-like protein